jgi:hypothetical protein
MEEAGRGTRVFGRKFLANPDLPERLRPRRGITQAELQSVATPTRRKKTLTSPIGNRDLLPTGVLCSRSTGWKGGT